MGEEPKYDINHALVLCRMHGFSPGLLFLYEHMRLFREVLQVRIAATLPIGSVMCPANSTMQLISSCHKILDQARDIRVPFKAWHVVVGMSVSAATACQDRHVTCAFLPKPCMRMDGYANLVHASGLQPKQPHSVNECSMLDHVLCTCPNDNSIDCCSNHYSYRTNDHALPTAWSSEDDCP